MGSGKALRCRRRCRRQCHRTTTAPPTLARFAQMANDRVRPLGTPTAGLNNDIDARFRAPKAIKRLLNDAHRLVIERILNSEYNAVRNAAAIIRPQSDQAGERSTGKPGIRRDGILQVPKQKLKIRAIGNADIRNGLQRFWYIAACGRLHAAYFPVGFRLGYTVWRRAGALS